MLLPNVIISMWSRVSPRVPAHVCRRGAAPPPRHGLSRSVPPASVSQGTFGSCSSPIASVATLGRCEVGGRDMQRHEVLLLDRRQGVGELALAPDFRTITAANFVIIMKAVGFCVAFLSHPVNGVPVVSTCTRSVLSTNRQSSSASNNTSPRASIRSGFFRNRFGSYWIPGSWMCRWRTPRLLSCSPP